MGRHLGIVFSWILMDFGSQVGRQNEAKIDPKRHRKNDAKKIGTKMANKTVLGPTTPIGGGGPRSRGGIPPIVW